MSDPVTKTHITLCCGSGSLCVRPFSPETGQFLNDGPPPDGGQIFFVAGHAADGSPSVSIVNGDGKPTACVRGQAAQDIMNQLTFAAAGLVQLNVDPIARELAIRLARGEVPADAADVAAAAQCFVEGAIASKR